MTPGQSGNRPRAPRVGHPRGDTVTGLFLARTIGGMVSSRGGKYGFVYRSRHKAYRALRRKGLPKKIAAMISNAGRTFPQRSIMARKAAQTRRLKGRRR